MAWGPDVRRDGDALTIGETTYRREPDRGPPPAPPEKWRGLIGEYGPDFSTLYVLERDGKLHALIEWVFLYPLTEVDESTFAFPDGTTVYSTGLDRAIFSWDLVGRDTLEHIVALPLGPDIFGENFTITSDESVAVVAPFGTTLLLPVELPAGARGDVPCRGRVAHGIGCLANRCAA